MANRIPGWGGEPAKKSNIRPNKTIKTGPKKGIKKPTANNRFRSLAVRRNATLRNKLNKVRGLTRSNKSANLRAFAAANNENRNGNENGNGNGNENENGNENNNENGLGLNLGGGAGGGLFEPQPIVRPKAVRAYPPPVAPAPAGRDRGMGFNMANLAGALPPLNLGPAAAGPAAAGGAPVRRSIRNNNNELRRRKTRTN